MHVLQSSPDSASLAASPVLEVPGVRFDVRRIGLAAGQPGSDDCRSVRPPGKTPAQNQRPAALAIARAKGLGPDFFTGSEA